jgi:hypothetical protein
MTIAGLLIKRDEGRNCGQREENCDTGQNNIAKRIAAAAIEQSNFGLHIS